MTTGHSGPAPTPAQPTYPPASEVGRDAKLTRLYKQFAVGCSVVAVLALYAAIAALDAIVPFEHVHEWAARGPVSAACLTIMGAAAGGALTFIRDLIQHRYGPPATHVDEQPLQLRRFRESMTRTDDFIAERTFDLQMVTTLGISSSRQRRRFDRIGDVLHDFYLVTVPERWLSLRAKAFGTPETVRLPARRLQR
jgi:hypothetical protein